MTSSRDFWPKLVMASRSSAVRSTSSPMVLTWARLRQLRGRSERSRSSMGRSRSGEPLVEVPTSPSSRPWGSSSRSATRPTSERRVSPAEASASRGRERPVGLDVEDEAVEVGRLLDPHRLDREGHPAHGREDRVDGDDADGVGALVALGRGVAPAPLHGDVDGQAALGVQRGDVAGRG